MISGDGVVDGFRRRLDQLAAIGRDPATGGLNRLAWTAADAAARAWFDAEHVEQGRGLVHSHRAVGVGTGIWPHGRWRYELTGQTNHAGTTALGDRRDPMLVAAELVAAAREEAQRHGAVATVGRLTAAPGATNAVPGRVRAWLDARARDDATLEAVVSAVERRTHRAADTSAVACEVAHESATGGVTFDRALRQRLEDCVADEHGPPPRLATAAGHDAGALAAQVPTGMLYVRNRSGVSHSPAEQADVADCVAGVRGLTTALRTLLA